MELIEYQEKNILIAARDINEYRSLINGLQERGFNIIESTTGPDALQRILFEKPSLIIIEAEIPIIDGFKVFEIIKTNPRTKHINVLFIHTERLDIPHFNKELDQYILKPFHEDEIIRKIELAFLSKQNIFLEKSELEGSLLHMSMADLLQIMSMNRRDGIIILSDEDKRGEIYLVKGNIVNATVGKLEGEKALFRLLQWRNGKFKFTSGNIISPIRIKKPTYQVLMEGMRQMDEIGRFIELLPMENELIIIDQDGLTEISKKGGVYKELFYIFDLYTRVSDIVENCSYPDYEVYVALLELIEKKIIKSIKPDEKSTEVKVDFDEEFLELIRILSSTGWSLSRVFFFLKRWDYFEHLRNILICLPMFHIDQTIAESSYRSSIPLRIGRLSFPGCMEIDFFATEINTQNLPLCDIIMSKSLIAAVSVMGKEDQEDETIRDIKRYLYHHFKIQMESFIIENRFDERLLSLLKNGLKRIMPEKIGT